MTGRRTRRQARRRTGRTALVALAVTALSGCTRGEAQQPVTQAELEDAAARLLPIVEERSGLRALDTPRVAIRSRATLERYLTEQLEKDLPPARAEALTAVYARLGLVPDTLQLVPLLKALLLEQIVGYYDPAADTLFVVDRVQKDSVELVLVHELVHALQDQHTDMDSLLRAVENENDRSTAARAAVEGHATFAMTEWQLGEMMGTSVDLTGFPNLAEMGATLDLGALPGMAVLAEAPRFVRESILFPYLGGLGFMQAYWAAQPDRPVPLGLRLPESSEQILHPELSFGVARDAPTSLTFLAGPPDGWQELHADGLGELEIRILFEELLGDDWDDGTAAEAAAGWDGDRYRLLRSGLDETLVWVSVWDSPADAAHFARAVSAALSRRYGVTEGPELQPGGSGLYGPLGAQKRWLAVHRGIVDERPAVTVLDFAADDPGAVLNTWIEVARFRAGGP